MRRTASPTRGLLVEAAIGLIDDRGGASAVTLREIAEAVGCSPPNAYNWFSGLDDLLTAALVRICEDFLERLAVAVPAGTEPQEAFVASVRVYVEFAVDHPGRLNVYHFERLTASLGPEALAAGEAVGRIMAELLSRGTDPSLPPGAADGIAAVLHSYLIGRLSDHITGRAPVEDHEDLVDSVVAETLQLHRVLTVGWR